MDFEEILNDALFEELQGAVGTRKTSKEGCCGMLQIRTRCGKKIFRNPSVYRGNLVDALRPHLRQNQRINGLTPEAKVFTSLAFFATGCYQRSIAQNMHVAMERSTFSKVLTEVTNAMVDHMLPIHIKFPQNEVEFQAVKRRFYEKFHFPGVIGAIDCTYVAIVAPKTDDPERPGLAYYKRKGFYSLNVQMICDANLRILNCNARFPGATHDSAIWTLSAVCDFLNRKYENNELDSSWLIGDAGYPLQPWLLTPIDDAALNTPEARYTRQHILARNTIERCFGVLKQRFRCLLKHRVLHYAPEKAAKIVLSCAILHNLAHQANLELPEEFDADHNDVDEVADVYNRQGQMDYLHEGRRVRQQLVERYFTEEH